MKKPSLLAHPVSRRVVLLSAAGSLLATACREETVGLLVDELNPLHLLDEEGDEMPNVPSSAYATIFDPMFLYGQSIVSPSAGGGLNTAALVNPHGLPMQLLEVKFRVYPLNTNSQTFYSITGMGIGVKFDMGDIPVSDAEVPLAGFGTYRDTAEDSADGSPEQLIFPDPENELVTCTANDYRWRLKYPLYIPAGCVLTPTFAHLGQNQFPVVVDVIYVCRTMPAGWTPPAEVPVPWVGSFNSTAFNNFASQPAGADVSSELDLVNPYSQPLEVARLSGQLSLVWTNTANNNGVGVPEEDPGVHSWQLGAVKMRSRSGDELARAATPFNQLFPYDHRVWDIPQGWSLRPGEFYKVFLTVAATQAGTAPYRLGRVQYSMSVIGYRKLDVRTFEIAAKGGA